MTPAVEARANLTATGDALDRERVVGRLEPASIDTEHPYRADGGAGVWSRTISHPGATYLRIHFQEFDLADGDLLEISGAEGRGPRAYTGRGPLGTGAFWAFTVPGDTAVLTLRAPIGGSRGFRVDAYGRGTEPVFDIAGSPQGSSEEWLAASLSGAGDATTLSNPSEPGPSEPGPTGLVCGAQDWNDVACYRYDHPAAAGNARAAVLAIEGCCTQTTAFKVSDSGQFMGAYRASVASLELFLDYQNAYCGGQGAAPSGSVMGKDVLCADPVLDYALFTTVGDASAIPCLQLDRRQPALGERIYIPEHPWGAPTKLAIASDLDAGGVCTVDALAATLVPPTNEIGFLCDTSEGSLGAPVVSGATNRVVGINHRGACPNAAVRMDLIWPQVSGLVDACSNGFACQPIGGSRCDCDGVCSAKELRYASHGGVCPDCWEEPNP